MEKEPTYTLENVQVDCRELSKEDIDSMIHIYIKNNFKCLLDDYEMYGLDCFLRYGFGLCEILITTPNEDYNTITYDKFMELFDSKETKPTQYQIGIDTFERMEANCSKDEILAFIKGNIDKYNWRKKGSDKEDFEKIIEYAKFALKTLNNGVE